MALERHEKNLRNAEEAIVLAEELRELAFGIDLRAVKHEHRWMVRDLRAAALQAWDAAHGIKREDEARMEEREEVLVR